MAEIIHFKKHTEHYEFRLSNKPEFLFLCDLEDFSSLFTGGWYVHISTAGKNPRPYIRTASSHGKHVHFHRHVMDAGEFEPQKIVDHISRDTLDNRKSNLRIVNAQESTLNRGYMGRQGLCDFVMCGEIKIPITKVTRVRVDGEEKVFYQAYFKSKYIAGSSDIEICKRKINEYFNKEKESESKEQSKGCGE